MAIVSAQADGYDVFLSFRGETRKKFSDHLYTALVQEGYRTFRDDEEIKKGESLGPELVKAIEGSKISIIVFSKYYAFSPWCLDEVVMILKCRTNSGHVVLPVFYDIRPSEIRKQKGRTGEAFDGYIDQYVSEIDIVKKMKLREKVKAWKEALEQVADLAGMELRDQADGHEAKFIEQIIKVIGNKLSPVKLDVGLYEIGIDSRAREINMWLQDGSNDVGALGICGMGGIGKTTIAKHVYNQNRKRFNGSCFLANIKEICKQPNGLVGLQRQLLSDVLKRKQEEISNVDEGITKIKNTLRRKRVLLVFDDVDHIDHLYAVRGIQDQLFPGSKIIITTRTENLLKPHEVYKLQPLDREESVTLFSLHAFGKECPPESHKEQTKSVIQLCGGLPLALQVLGRSLSRKSVDQWVNKVKKLQAIPHNEILEKLKISYDSLQDDFDKRLFLHISCFFLGEDKDEIVILLENCDLHAAVGIENLTDRCLLTVDSRNKLSMHQLIRDMGREIVRQESPNEPGERSRLWLSKDSFNVLKNKTGTHKIEGLTLVMRMLKDDVTKSRKRRHEELENSMQSNQVNSIKGLWQLPSYTSTSPNEVELGTNAFHGMKNLRFLRLDNVHLSGSYKYFPKNLRWMCWHNFPLKLVPAESSLDNLVFLDMSYSKFKQVWKGTKLLGSLKILNLSYCKGLTITPNFSGSRYLERLVLKGCSSLVKICESIELLKELALLDLEYCKSLEKLPRNIHVLRSLETLIISGCSNLVEFPTNMRNMPSLQVLHANQMARISKELYLTSLLGSLVELSLVSCGLYEDSFPSAFGDLTLLKVLDISNNFFGTLPNSVKRLSNLKTLTICSSRLLQSILGLPCTLEYMDMGSCYFVKKVSFQSTQTRIAEVDTSYCEDLDEIEGFFKIEPLANVDPKLIELMGIDIESMENIELPFQDLDTTRMRPIQGLYEFGIFSTFIPTGMFPSFDKRKGSSISFTMPLLPNHEMLYLNVLCVYACSSFLSLVIKIHNWTKNLKWIYLPVCYGNPYKGKDMAWLSLWNFRNQLKSGDEVTVSFSVGIYGAVEECGVKFVFKEEQEENDEEEECDNHHDKPYYFGNEIVGGDLSNFQVSGQTYILSRTPIDLVDNEGYTDDSRETGIIDRKVRCTVLSRHRYLPSALLPPIGLAEDSRSS